VVETEPRQFLSPNCAGTKKVNNPRSNAKQADLLDKHRQYRRRTSLLRALSAIKWSMLGVALLGIYLTVDQSGPRSGKADTPSNSSARSISAHPNLSRVIDADTIVVGDIHVRLDGISAPERGHSAYSAGKWFVADLMRAASAVECALEGRKSYEREIGTCVFVMANGQRIYPQVEVVKAGFARDCPRYSGGRYKNYETPASRALPLPRYC